jgi:hypothetical protein
MALSCKKKDNTPQPNPPLSKIPVISIESLSASSIKALTDTLTIRVKYTDGDGDIGFAEADSAVIYVTDNRFPITMGYHVPPLSPNGATLSITGILPVVVKNIILQNGSGAEQVTFSVKLRDRAGNWSNVVTTGAVTVLP